MGLFDKLKNVFFEEEEVEVVEKEEPREKIPVAKKIDVEVSKKEEVKKVEPNKEFPNTMEFKKKEEHLEKDFKFPMGFDDKDFEVERTMEIFAKTKEIEVPKVINEISDEPPMEKQEEVIVHHKEQEEIKEPQRVEHIEHRLYEGKEEQSKTAFTPSPIISPIYGILNKNYKKEEIISKSEMKSAKIESKKDDLDIIREKAYGDLAKDISSSIEEDISESDEVKDIKKEKEDLLYDLSEDSSPAVKVVTVGDAEEYFNDLGLEYNVDYKVEKEDNKEEKEINQEKKTRSEKTQDTEEDDKNLFDLIDAMYDDEEKD